MQALSDAQLTAASEGGVPEPELVDRSGGAELWSVPVPMPGEMLAYTLSAILLDAEGGAIVVDPGWETDQAHELLAAFLAERGRAVADITQIVVTHAHPDHLGAADALRSASGAELLLHEREQRGIDRVLAGGGLEPAAMIAEWGAPAEAEDRLIPQLLRTRQQFTLPSTPADRRLRDGDMIIAPGAKWVVVSTPGHTAGHICIADPGRALLLTGDHVLPTIFPGIGLGVDLGLRGEGDPNPVADYLASLARLEPYDGFRILPGHGYRFLGLAERRAEMTAHILTRAREVADAVAREPDSTVWKVASKLSWSAGWERLSTGPMLASALLQTGYHLEFVRAGGLERLA